MENNPSPTQSSPATQEAKEKIPGGEFCERHEMFDCFICPVEDEITKNLPDKEVLEMTYIIIKDGKRHMKTVLTHMGVQNCRADAALSLMNLVEEMKEKLATLQKE